MLLKGFADEMAKLALSPKAKKALAWGAGATGLTGLSVWGHRRKRRKEEAAAKRDREVNTSLRQTKARMRETEGRMREEFRRVHQALDRRAERHQMLDRHVGIHRGPAAVHADGRIEALGKKRNKTPEEIRKGQALFRRKLEQIQRADSYEEKVRLARDYMKRGGVVGTKDGMKSFEEDMVSGRMLQHYGGS